MIRLSRIADLRARLRELKQSGKSIGFVPTMGYLHEGHISLVEAAREQCDTVVMSIFVNPLQFGPNEDYDRYPRDLDRDQELARAAGVDVLFTPAVEEMYPTPMLTTVSVRQVTEGLCGASRPGHFDGVATVVTKLFQIVQPDKAYFGMKDVQQVAVIQQMVHDLSIPVEVVACPTVREADGLAKSSRNVYLTEQERKQARVLYQSLQEAERLIRSGVRSAEEIRRRVEELIRQQPLATIDYVEIVHYPSLLPATLLQSGDRVCVAVAVRFGGTRLIDNLIVQVDEQGGGETKCFGQ